MWPLLKVGGGAGTRNAAVVANLSARVGSIGDNNLGGWHSYRASKAALNQCKILLILESKCMLLCLHGHIYQLTLSLKIRFRGLACFMTHHFCLL